MLKRLQNINFSKTCEFKFNKYARPRNTRTEMYAGRVACCPPVSHVEYAPRALLMLDKRRDGRTDARPLHYAYSYH